MDLSIRTIPGDPTRDYSWLAGDGSAFETAQSGTLDVSTLVSGTHYDAATGIVPSGLAVSKVGNVFQPYLGVSEVQLVTITGGPTGGTFTLTFDGETTAGIAFNATAAAVQTALEALSNAEPGDVSVSGSNGGPYTITFGGKYTGKNVPQLTANSGSLTGGTSPTATPSTSTAGVAGTLDGFVAHPVGVLTDGVLATKVIFARVVDAVLIPANLPVAAQRAINQNTPTTGKFAFVS